ncbi:MAG: SDR family oxidoreductase [Novosphingobium sp.]|nr:SDR family oxidoreductase [Novosphingobium sp.]
MTGTLAGKVAVVTGAASGIGRATATRFVKEGASVVAVDVNASALADLAREVAVALTIEADLTEADDVTRIFATMRERFGRLDVLVNNAGIGGPRTLRLHELPLADFDTVMSVNLRAPLAMTQGALALLREQGGGAIVNVASPAGYHAVENLASYSISKAGVVMLTKCTAKEYAAEGIRCNAVAPGVTRTPILEGLPQPHLDAICAAIPQNRVAEPPEIAAMIAFLASDQASYVNGSIHFVDGAADT